MSEFIITRDDGSQELLHYGIKGQKWGDRNYQYEDGTLTPEGKERYKRLRNKYRPFHINAITNKSETTKNNKLTEKGYEALIKTGKVRSGTDIGLAGVGAAGSVATLFMGSPATIPASILAASITTAANLRESRRIEKIIHQDKKTTMSEVNEYLALAKIKKS